MESNAPSFVGSPFSLLTIESEICLGLLFHVLSAGNARQRLLLKAPPYENNHLLEPNTLCFVRKVTCGNFGFP